jgi:hypothetical protein
MCLLLYLSLLAVECPLSAAHKRQSTLFGIPDRTPNTYSNQRSRALRVCREIFFPSQTRQRSEEPYLANIGSHETGSTHPVLSKRRRYFWAHRAASCTTWDIVIGARRSRPMGEMSNARNARVRRLTWCPRADWPDPARVISCRTTRHARSRATPGALFRPDPGSVASGCCDCCQ